MDKLFSPDELLRLLGLVGRIADHHACSINDAITILGAHAPTHGAAGGGIETVGEYAGRIHRLRPRRNDVLGADVTRDPAWDILLGLGSAHGEGREACVKTPCFGTGVPQTTALRHIERLERAALVSRQSHDTDHHRMTVHLVPERIGDLERLINQFREMS